MSSFSKILEQLTIFHMFFEADFNEASQKAEGLEIDNASPVGEEDESEAFVQMKAYFKKKFNIASQRHEDERKDEHEDKRKDEHEDKRKDRHEDEPMEYWRIYAYIEQIRAYLIMLHKLSKSFSSPIKKPKEELEAFKKCLFELDKTIKLLSQYREHMFPEKKQEESSEDPAIEDATIEDSSILSEKINAVQNTFNALEDRLVGNQSLAEPLADEPLADEPLVDEPLADEPLADEPLADEPLADEPLADERLVDKPRNRHVLLGTAAVITSSAGGALVGGAVPGLVTSFFTTMTLTIGSGAAIGALGGPVGIVICAVVAAIAGLGIALGSIWFSTRAFKPEQTPQQTIKYNANSKKDEPTKTAVISIEPQEKSDNSNPLSEKSCENEIENSQLNQLVGSSKIKISKQVNFEPQCAYRKYNYREESFIPRVQNMPNDSGTEPINFERKRKPKILENKASPSRKALPTASPGFFASILNTIAESISSDVKVVKRSNASNRI